MAVHYLVWSLALVPTGGVLINGRLLRGPPGEQVYIDRAQRPSWQLPGVSSSVWHQADVVNPWHEEDLRAVGKDGNNGTLPLAVGLHAMNIRGDRFSIRQPGKHTFISIPRLFKPKDLYVRVHLTPLGSTCGPLRLTHVSIRGSWLYNTGDLEFYAKGQNFSTPEGVGLKVNESENMSVAEFISRVPASVAEVNQTHGELPEDPTEQVDTLVIKIQAGPVALTVGWAHTQAPLSNWLWLSADELYMAKQEVGGLLGMDDNLWETTRPKECREQPHEPPRKPDAAAAGGATPGKTDNRKHHATKGRHARR
mmetsp:Transcript_95404/g.269584  ORF Transcript_95404/g.269584 Transcript_95404/m.269584 type:complete len:309 (-) Transcript_95404:108-1034(-)